MDTQTLIGRAAVAVSNRGRLFRLLAAVLLLIRPAAVASAEPDLPDRPTGYLMDSGAIFPPEKAREISDALNACARDYDIHIYIVTLPSLKVLPSRAREKIDGMLDTARLKWLDGKTGAAMIFDHETALAALSESEGASREFPPVLIHGIFMDPHLKYRKNVRAADQVAGAATVLIEKFTALRIQANEEARRRRTMQLGFGVILCAAILMGLVATIVKNRAPIRGTETSPPDSAHAGGEEWPR